MSDAILCPECGWTGSEDEILGDDGEHECPVCAEAIEFVE